MRDPMKNFWQQPAEGFTPQTAGRSDEQLAQWEKGCGFKLPSLYKAHMRQQNGGLPWPQTYVHEGTLEYLFVNSAEYAPILEDGKFVSPTAVYDDDLLLEVLGEDAKPERLYVLSWITGGNLLCLDYGYKLKTPREEPEVCYFETYEFKELFRVKSYEKFIEGLVYSSTANEGSWYIGITTALTQDVLAKHCSKALSLTFEKHEDDRYGWFNFTSWYFATSHHKTRGRLRYVLSPNKFNSGTWRFSGSQEVPFILEIELNDDLPEQEKESRAIIENIMRALRSDAVEAFLLLPE